MKNHSFFHQYPSQEPSALIQSIALDGVKANPRPLPNCFFTPAYWVVYCVQFEYSPSQQIQCRPTKIFLFSAAVRSCAVLLLVTSSRGLPALLGSASVPSDDALLGTNPSSFLNEGLRLLGYVGPAFSLKRQG